LLKYLFLTIDFFKSIIDTIMTASIDNVITGAKPASEKMLGYSEIELIDKSVEFFYADRDEYEIVSAEIEKKLKL
jgi:PAS domain S-box-containing protein